MALAPGWPGTEIPYSVSVPITRRTLMSAAYAAPTAATPQTHCGHAAETRTEGHAAGARAAVAARATRPCHRYWPVLATVSIDRPASVPVLPDTRVRM